MSSEVQTGRSFNVPVYVCLDVRFRRDAANLLDVLSAYQKRQIVEFLPYHHCDMMNQHSPDLNCLIELQGRYTQYRHTLFLTGMCQQYVESRLLIATMDSIIT